MIASLDSIGTWNHEGGHEIERSVSHDEMIAAGKDGQIPARIRLVSVIWTVKKLQRMLSHICTHQS